MCDNFLHDKNNSISKNVMTEHLEQIVAVTVVTVIKARHVTRRRGRVVRGVTQDTMGCTATKVRYLLILFRVLFNIDVNEIL